MPTTLKVPGRKLTLEIVKKYSNFVNFPILVNSEKVNTIQALWAMDKSSISPEQYTEFYRFVSNTWDAPQYYLHYKADAPLQINCLLYIPGFNAEAATFTRMDSGVSLYSRKVLIKPKAHELLPDWLRFVQGFDCF